MTDKPDDKDKPDEKLSLDDLIAEAQGKKPEESAPDKPDKAGPDKPASDEPKKAGPDKPAPDKPDKPDKPAAPPPPPPPPPPVKDKPPAGPPPAAKPKDAAPDAEPKPEAGPPPKIEPKSEAPTKPDQAPPVGPAAPPPLPKRDEAPPVRPSAPPQPGPPPAEAGLTVTPPTEKPSLPQRDEPLGPSPRAEKEKEEAKPAPAKLPAAVTGPLHLILLAASWFVMLAGIWSNWALVSNPWLKIGLVVAPAAALVPSILLWRSTAWTFKTGLSCLMAALIGLILWGSPVAWWKNTDRVFNLLGYPAPAIILLMLLALGVAAIVLWWSLLKRYKIAAAVLTVITLYSVYPLVYALGQDITLTQVFDDSVWLLVRVPWWIDPLYVLFEVVFPLAMVLALVTYFIRLFGTRKAQVYLWTFLIMAAASATGFAFLNTVPRQDRNLPHLLSGSQISQSLRIPSLDDRVLAVKRQVADITAGFFFIRGLRRSAGDAVEKLDQNLKDAATRRKRQLTDINRKLKQMQLKQKQLLDMKKKLQQEGGGGPSSSGAR